MILPLATTVTFVVDGADSRLQDSFTLRDDEQLLVKFSYRFEH